MLTHKTTTYTHIRWSAGALLLAGFILRALLLTHHGLEGDDAFSLALSRQSVGALWQGLMSLSLDVHPPLHFIVLKGWAALVGESLPTLRWMSLLLDALTGALMMRIAGQIGGRGAVVTTGALWAVSPLLIFGGWLLRMYTLLGALNIGALSMALHALRRERALWVLPAALLSLAAAYTHISGALILAVLGAALVGWGRGRLRVLAVVAFGVAGLLWLPFAIPTAQLFLSDAALGASVNPQNALAPLQIPSALGAVTFAHRVPLAPLTGVVLLLLPLLARPRGRMGWVLLSVTAAVYLGLVGLGVAGLYKPRYVVPFAPLMLATLGAGTWGRGTRIMLTGGLVLLGGFSVSLDLGRAWRDDWTGAAAFIARHALPQDVIMVVPDWGQEALRFHDQSGAPIRGFFPQIDATLDLDAAFTPFVASAERVWLVRYQPEVSDADGRAAAWLLARCPAVTEAFPSGMLVLLYDCTPQHNALPPSARALDAAFGEQLALRGVHLPPQQVGAQDTRLYDGSGRVLVSLYWQALVPAPPVMPRVRLTSPYGEVYGGALSSGDDVLARVPVDTWQPNTLIRVTTDLNINPSTPDGIYNIEVMVLDADGNPLPASGADAGAQWVIAGQVAVE